MGVQEVVPLGRLVAVVAVGTGRVVVVAFVRTVVAVLGILGGLAVVDIRMERAPVVVLDTAVAGTVVSAVVDNLLDEDTAAVPVVHSTVGLVLAVLDSVPVVGILDRLVAVAVVLVDSETVAVGSLLVALVEVVAAVRVVGSLVVDLLGILVVAAEPVGELVVVEPVASAAVVVELVEVAVGELLVELAVEVALVAGPVGLVELQMEHGPPRYPFSPVQPPGH